METIDPSAASGTSQPAFGPLGSEAERESFRTLMARLPSIAERLATEEDFEHTSVIVPSVSVNQEELQKITGAVFYEERLLFFLMRLTNPSARLVYVTSQPIHPDVLEYYLQHIAGIPQQHALDRLQLLCLYDASPRPLTQKILERPRVLDRMRDFIGDPGRAYLTCYNSTPLERRLAVELGIPLNAPDPDLLWAGTKSGGRRIFAQAGVPHPAGVGDIRSEDDILTALRTLADARPGLQHALVKLNDSFAGEGNALFTYPCPDPESESEVGRTEALRTALTELQWSGRGETLQDFVGKLGTMGGVVEEMVGGDRVFSPSVQMRIDPVGGARILSTHDQVLGGATGQVYLGCRFPADAAYRAQIQTEASKIGAVLTELGVIGRFGIDFLAVDDGSGGWTCHAIEINLRMGGTTPPFMALEFLTGGSIDPASGLFHSPHGKAKYYYATDNLRGAAYVGLLPDDLIDLLVEHRLQFRHSTQTGVLFYMIGGLSQYGKVGVTSIGDSREEADELYATTVAILDRETGGRRDDTTPRALYRDWSTRID